MSSIASFIVLFWINLQVSLSLQIFMLSLVTLFCCLLLLTWKRAVRLSFFNSIPLDEIELQHPHIPSLRAIVTIFLCSIALFVTSLGTIGTISIFSGPYEILYLAALFVLSAVIWILAEVRCKCLNEYNSAFIIGTALAFICMVFIGVSRDSWIITATFLALLVGSTLLAWRVLYSSWNDKAQTFFIITFIMWFILYGSR